MRFIDLFAGLGGFHIALKDLGHSCVFASELNEDLRKLYEINHEMECHGDINTINVSDIPSHDIICAGFPCQPFSKAGKRNGLSDPDNGNLFNRIMEIADFHKPEYIFLENVPNLYGHDNGNTWKYIHAKLSVNYEVKEQILSPHKFGIPQHRSRIYIVCRLWSKGGLGGFEFPHGNFRGPLSINSIINENSTDIVALKPNSLYQLQVWQEFLDQLKPEDVPRFPIWAMEFGASYPFEEQATINYSPKELSKFKGKFGQKLKGSSFNEIRKGLPGYAQTDQEEFPHWKKYYIRANREFYEKNRDWLDNWIPKIFDFENSHQKLEWNCGNKSPLILNDKIIQFRPSGIRVKKPDFSPALVLSSTQIPIFPWLNRYMTKKEAAKLQGMENLKSLPASLPKTFRALGNAVNVFVVRSIAKCLIIENE